MTTNSCIYQLKITLKGTRPPIWRRVQVPDYMTLQDLHEVIQRAMGWANVHLWTFEKKDLRYEVMDEDNGVEAGEAEDAAKTRLRDVLVKPGSRMTYVYDFGDDWRHEVLLERTLSPAEGQHYPLCVAGKRACPPEDIGGPYRFQRYLSALRDPQDPEHEAMLEYWGSFDPDAFDLDDVNEELRAIEIPRPDPTEEPMTPPRRTRAGSEAWRAFRATERLFRRLADEIEGQEFDSLEELNAYLQALANSGVLDRPADTPAERAQELVDRAWDESSPAKRVRLAKEALALWPACLDAYSILASEAADMDEALRLLREGVRVGEEDIGREMLEEQAGHFWSLVKTRPYMRVRYHLALGLWAVGHHDEAMEHAEALLRLDIRDHMGIRFDLVNWYLALQQTAQAGGLFTRFGEEDPSCLWQWPRALWLFQREGDSPRARQVLAEVARANPHLPLAVVRFALHGPPVVLPDSYDLGGPEEAELAVYRGLLAWMLTPGALGWWAKQLSPLVVRDPADLRRGRQRRRTTLGGGGGTGLNSDPERKKEC